jgi:outer membrane protein assembly complex protein YaeT
MARAIWKGAISLQLSRRSSIGVALVLTALSTVSCRETGDVLVTSISFSGNTAIPASQLKTVIATQETGILPWGRKHFFDRAEFELDLKRIVAFYADRGYPGAKVVGFDVGLNDSKDKVDLTIEIAEGAPVIVENISFEGLDSLPPDHVQELRVQLPIKPGLARNQKLILLSHDLIVGELRDHGFPYGTARIEERPGSVPERVQLAAVADTGPKSVFGSITVEGDTSVAEDVILRGLVFREGDEYRLSDITESQRRLYGLELFQFVNITPRLPEDRSPKVPVTVLITEGKHRRLQLALGYGSEERARARVNWRHVNFTGRARTADLEAKASRLEQGIRGSFTEPHFLALGTSFRLTGGSWWATEPTYTYRSQGGRAIITKEFGSGSAGIVRGVRNTLRGSLIREYENYAIAPAALNDLAIRDQLIALGLDPASGKGTGTLSAFAIDFDRDTSGRPLDPRRGYLVSGHIESAQTWLAGSFKYNEFMGEGRKYFEFGPRLVWASRLRAGTLAGADGAQIPFYKRYFAGGSTGLRGWGRYQVSPLFNGLPIGGRTMMEVSTEARFGVRGKLSGVLFVDGGNVWTEAWSVRPRDLRWDAGPGLRYDTPIGPVRVDLGIQLNPIQGLLINGTPEGRRWRIHFSIGQAF